MLNKDGVRELAYLVQVTKVEPMVGYDVLELATVNGWTCVVGKGDFHAGDIGVYFEIDSKLPEVEPFTNSAAITKYHFKIKTQKFGRGGIKYFSQGLLMHPREFGWQLDGESVIVDHCTRLLAGDFLTQTLGITYYEPEDNARKAKSIDKYKLMCARHQNLFKKHKILRWLYSKKWGKKLLFLFLGKKRDKKTSFPTHFPFVKKTDQERCENMPWIFEDKTPYIVTQKCDGSSGTFILEKKGKKKFEFYVCSRNVRQLTPEQKSFYDENYYWQVAIKYDIENKLKDYLFKHPDLKYVCWQGEICGPGIQANPHKLSTIHLFCFHMIDSKKGKYDIREAAQIWKEYQMEIVPIVNENYILPNTYEEFKLEADGFYDKSVCEGKENCPREGFVYYKTNDPNFSFKNVSREYLLKSGQ